MSRAVDSSRADTCCAGVVREPLQGWEDDKTLGLLIGILLGTSGLILKPASGILDCLAKGFGGLGYGIRSLGDDIDRAPRTRIRSPRNFTSLLGSTGAAHLGRCGCLVRLAQMNCAYQHPCRRHRLTARHLQVPPNQAIQGEAQLHPDLCRGCAAADKVACTAGPRGQGALPGGAGDGLPAEQGQQGAGDDQRARAVP